VYALWLSKIVLTLKDRIATAHTQTVGCNSHDKQHYKMKRVITLTVLLTIICLTSRGQVTITDCGVDKNPILNKCELEFLDSFFADAIFKRKDYNFSDKKFAFVSGQQLIDKDVFFKSADFYRGPKGFDLFDNEQKAKTGYDGVIIINLKMYNKKTVIKLIEQKSKDNR
jgi:hypothetical protein